MLKEAVRKAFFKAQSFKNEVLLMNILKFIFHYEYRNEKEHLEADNSAHRVDSYGYCYHPWRYKLHGSQCVFLIERLKD